MTEEAKTIPDDAALDALGDTDLLELMEANGIDTSAVTDREHAIGVLKAKRDVAAAAGEPPQAPDALAPESAAPPQPSGPDAPAEGLQPPVAESVAQEEPEAPSNAVPASPRFSAVLAQAVKDAVGNHRTHAALHNFETAFADFRRAAANLSEIDGALDPNGPLGAFVAAVKDS